MIIFEACTRTEIVEIAEKLKEGIFEYEDYFYRPLSTREQLFALAWALRIEGT